MHFKSKVGANDHYVTLAPTPTGLPCDSPQVTLSIVGAMACPCPALVTQARKRGVMHFKIGGRI